MNAFRVFISSTYLDLEKEREIVTSAITNAHFESVGMDLFVADNNVAQWDLIEKEMEAADVVLFILGGRYGSICKDGKSYTHMEYELAHSLGKKRYAIVLSDRFLNAKGPKVSRNGVTVDVKDKQHAKALQQFKDIVVSDKRYAMMANTNDHLADTVINCLTEFMCELVGSWDGYVKLVRKMHAQIKGHYNSFIPDAIVGIKRGGLTTATMLARYRDMVPVIGLFSTVKIFDIRPNTDAFIEYNKSVIEYIVANNVKSILLVDSIAHDGDTLRNACNYLQTECKDIQIKTAVLVIDTKCLETPDYCLAKCKLNGHLQFKFPYKIEL